MTAPRVTAAALGLREAVVADAIGRAAQRTGVDFSYLYAQARSESGLDAGAQARSSSAAGLFQFIDQSWLGVLKLHGAEHGYGWAANAISREGRRWKISDPALKQAIFALRKDADAAALMAGEFASDNAAGLKRALGRAPAQADLYFAHFLGLRGASRFLKAADAAPDAPAAAAFPAEARANRGIFYRRSGHARSLGEVYALMARKLQGAGGEAPRGGGAGEVQMAAAPAAERTREATPDATMLALAGRQARPDLLRPDPRFAMLAYMMIASPLDAA